MGAGELEPGQLLPPMRELAERLGVNPEYRRGRLSHPARTRGDRDRRAAGAAGSAPGRPPPGASTSGSRCRRVCGTWRDGNPDPALLPSLATAFAAAAASRATGRRCSTETPPSNRSWPGSPAPSSTPTGCRTAPVAVTSGSLDAHRARPRRPPQARRHRRRRGPRVGQRCSTSYRRSGCARSRSGSTTKGRSPEVYGRRWRPGRGPLIVTDRAQNPTGRRR